jgi:predicted porin
MTSLKKLIAVVAVSLPLVAMAQPVPEPAPAAPPAAAPAAEPAKPAAAPAAKPPLVSVYGTLNLNLQYTEASDATAGSASDVSARAAISTDSSNVGVRGGLGVAHGLNVVYQCETAASIDGEDTRTLCNRNSRVGLSGDWGTLFYGNWDTPYKSGHYGGKADDPFGNTDTFGFQGVLGSPGYGVRSSAFNSAPTGSALAITTASFDQRAGNSVAYWSPKLSGLSFKVQASVDEGRSADGRVDPKLLSAVVNFDVGEISVGATAEYHEDAFGIRTVSGGNAGVNAAKDLAWRLFAGYELPLGVGNLTVMGMFEQLMYEQENAGTGFKDYSRLAWLLGAKFRTGNHELRARFSQALDPDITAATGTTLAAGAEDDLGAQHYALGYAYHLAKSTQVYAFYTQIMNDDRARYTFGVAGAAAIVGANTVAGADPIAVGLGMRHAF